MPRRLLAALTLATLAICATPALAADDPLGEINALRAAYGAPALQLINAPALEQAVARAHDASLGDGGQLEASEDGLPDCAVCASSTIIPWSKYGQEYPERLYTAWKDATGSAIEYPLPITLARERSVRDTLNLFPATAAYLLSPALTGDVVMARASGADILLIGDDPADRATGPLHIWPESGVVDPASPVVVFGGDGDTLAITPTGGLFAGRPSTLEADRRPPSPMWNDVTTAISWGARYTLTSGTHRLTITTTPMPTGRPAFTASVRPAQRRAYLAAARPRPALGRQLWSRMGPRVTILRAPCPGGRACVVAKGGRVEQRLTAPMFGTSPAQRFAIQSLNAWSVWTVGIDADGRNAFEKLLKSSGRYRCVKVYYDIGSACAGPEEYFRDEYARWATGSRMRAGYGTAPTLRPAAMARFLTTWFRLGPPSE